MAEEQAIPEAVMSEARKIVDAAEDECRAAKCLVVFPTVRGKEALDKHIARALLAAELRGRQAERDRCIRIIGCGCERDHCGCPGNCTKDDIEAILTEP